MVLKLHMPPCEARRHLRKRREADRGSVLRQRAGVDQHVAEQQCVIGGHGQRSVRQVRAKGAGVDAHRFASEFDEMRVGDDLQREIERRFGVTMQERTVGRQLAALGFRRLSVCPQHPKSDPQAQ